MFVVFVLLRIVCSRLRKLRGLCLCFFDFCHLLLVAADKTTAHTNQTDYINTTLCLNL